MQESVSTQWRRMSLSMAGCSQIFPHVMLHEWPFYEMYCAQVFLLWKFNPQHFYVFDQCSLFTNGMYPVTQWCMWLVQWCLSVLYRHQFEWFLSVAQCFNTDIQSIWSSLAVSAFFGRDFLLVQIVFDISGCSKCGSEFEVSLWDSFVYEGTLKWQHWKTGQLGFILF